MQDLHNHAPLNGCDTQVYNRKAKAPNPKAGQCASEYITIPVAEYHFLTKAATLLEIILADKSYSPNTVVAAARTVVAEMVQQAEAGAAE